MKDYQLELLDLLANAETPLYSAFVFSRERAAPALELTAFLQDVEALMLSGAVVLRHTDARTVELAHVPAGLALQYDPTELDGTYDPLGFSLALSPALDSLRSREWNADFDFVRGTFRIESETEPSAELLEILSNVSDRRLRVTTRSTSDGLVITVGTLAEGPDS
jgi:hypothetical protein